LVGLHRRSEQASYNRAETRNNFHGRPVFEGAGRFSYLYGQVSHRVLSCIDAIEMQPIVGMTKNPKKAL